MNDKCIVCGEKFKQNDRIMTCSDMPASAQNIPSQDELRKDVGIDLQLYQCSGCGLIQFDCEPVSYYRDVIRAGGYSSTMVELRRKQYQHFIEYCNLQGKKVIEIGCGQGEFLKVLKEFPVQVYGIEHKKELVEKAQKEDLNVWQDFTETEDQKLSEAPFDAFLSFNFLEHQPYPNEMLRCIYNNLSEEGVGLVTVPDLDYIVSNDSFYELLHDHIANYSEETLRFLLNKNGFIVLESTIVNQDTISMIVQKRPKLKVDGLRKNYDLLVQQMKRFIAERMTKSRKVAVWGASHQGFTAISTTGSGETIEYIIDSAPFKQGKYAPASHVPIVSPEYFFKKPVDTILIIAPGYTDEIAGIIREKYGSDVEIAAIRTSEIEILHI